LLLIKDFEVLVYLPSLIRFVIFNEKKEIGEWMFNEGGYIYPQVFEWNIT